MVNAKNLWGEWTPPKNLRTPYATLKEQAAILDKMTDGLLMGDIQRSQEGNTVVIRFRIKAPALNNYTFSVLDVRHSVKLYPVNVLDQTGEIAPSNCEDEEEFEQVLHQILSSEEVRKVVAALLADIRVDRNDNEPDFDDIPF